MGDTIALTKEGREEEEKSKHSEGWRIRFIILYTGDEN